MRISSIVYAQAQTFKDTLDIACINNLIKNLLWSTPALGRKGT